MFPKVLRSLSLGLIAATLSLEGYKASSDLSENHLLHKIIENQRYCVHDFDGDKIFIRADKLIATNQGLFLDLNGKEFSLLPIVHSNSSGSFLLRGPADQLQMEGKKKTKGPCGNCYADTDEKGICQNKECWFYGLKVQ